MAVAFIGNPPIILLDEPSASLDPYARRCMWSVIRNVKDSAIVISTHSMEEAEALSTKMAIMTKGGEFKCFGSSQAIRSEFATSFEVELRFCVDAQPLNNEYFSLQECYEYL